MGRRCQEFLSNILLASLNSCTVQECALWLSLANSPADDRHLEFGTADSKINQKLKALSFVLLFAVFLIRKCSPAPINLAFVCSILAEADIG